MPRPCSAAVMYLFLILLCTHARARREGEGGREREREKERERERKKWDGHLSSSPYLHASECTKTQADSEHTDTGRQ